MDATNAFSSLPTPLRNALIDEYTDIIQHYMEHKWSAAELSGGRFCEIVYSIIRGMADGAYPQAPSKPRNMVQACQKLENETNLPRSTRILIPRMLPVLYEIRNNRNVGHVGGDVDPSHMDSNAVVHMCSWVMAELVRVMHQLTTEEAQKLVRSLSEIRTPIVWSDGGGLKRILNTSLSLKEQAIVLIASEATGVDIWVLMGWLDYKNRQYFVKLLKELHSKRLIEFNESQKMVIVLPPGAVYAAQILRATSS